MYINDQPGVVGSDNQLFADDCKLYKIIESDSDQTELQEDILRLCHWSKDWLRGFNINEIQDCFLW